MFFSGLLSVEGGQRENLSCFVWQFSVFGGVGNINVIQNGRIYPFVIVAIDRIDNIAKAVNSRIIAAIFLKQTFHPHKSAPDSP